MTLHLIRARLLAHRLAAGHVSSREQAVYLSAGFILWLLPGYLFVIPPPNPSVWSVPFGLWFYEALALTIVFILGVFYCLARCRIDANRNFLIDFSCLYVPISLTTLLIVWGIFHIYASLLPWWLQSLRFESQPYLLEFMYSARFFDLTRFLANVSVTFIVFIRVGSEMEQVSRLRMSANE